jgi:hypothetical protein
MVKKEGSDFSSTYRKDLVFTEIMEGGVQMFSVPTT